MPQPLRWFQTTRKRLLVGGVVLVGLFTLGGLAASGTNDPKSKYYASIMKGDLVALEKVEAAAFMDSSRYTRTPRFSPSSAGVSAPTVVVTDRGWSATVTWSAAVTYRGFRGLQCGIAVGVKNPIAPDAQDGEPACKSAGLSPADATGRRD